MAYRIRDKYTFEEFDSIEEFSTSLKDNKWKRHIPTKKVKIKGRETLGIRLQDKGTKGIFVKLDFSKILKEVGMEKPVKQQPDFETFLVKNKHRKNEPSCFISIKDSGGKYTIQSLLSVKGKGKESVKILLITTELDMENRIKEIRRRRRPAHRKSNDQHSEQFDDDWDDDDDWYYDDLLGGRTPADDRADSMNPESPRYNPSSRW
tara:strand:- start:71 stop:688 length:618 start_codon:yes stop_codon:yes gene_type:complete